MIEDNPAAAPDRGAALDRIPTLALLSALLRGAAQPAAVALQWQHTFRDRPPSDVDARIRFLVARLGLPEIHPARLAEVWDTALKGGYSPDRRELLDLARRAVVTWEEAEADIGPWRRAMFARLEPTLVVRGALDFTEETPTEVRQSHLDLGPLLTQWPRRLLHHPDWAYLEAPLPEMAPLPLAEAWVNLRLVPMEEGATLPSGEAVRDALDLRYVERGWSSQPLELTLDQLDGPAVLIGPPGSGKTTLLKWIARRLISNPEGRFLLPLIAPLRVYPAWKRQHPESDLLDFGLYQAGVIDARQQELWTNALSYLAGPHRENVLLMLDGWDEVREEDREPLQREIGDFSHGFTILLTSRPSGRPESLLADDLFEITELPPESIELLIDRWFEQAREPDLAAVLRAQLDRSLDLRRLARNPFLLTLLCGLVLRSERTGAGSLPASRAEIYQATLELIYRYDQRRYGENRWPKARRLQVERLALWLLEEAPEAPRYVFDAKDVAASGADLDLLERYLKPSRLLTQQGLAPDSHHFLHTTFQEFLVALGLTSEPPGALLGRLRRHFFSGAWQEVFQFLAGLTGPVRELFWRQLAQLARETDRFGHLALRMARFVAEAGFEDGGLAALGIDLREPLWLCIQYFFANEHYVDAYAMLDPAGLVERVRRALPGADLRTQSILLQAAARLATPEGAEALVAEILDESSGAELTAVLHIGRHRRIVGPPLARLRSAAESRQVSPVVRQRAIWALGAIGDHRSLARIVAALREDGANAEAALYALAVLGTDEAVAAIAQLIEEADDPRLAALAVDNLKMTYSPAGRDLLLEIVALRPAEDPLVIAALKTIAVMPMPIHSGGEILIALLNHRSSAALRMAAAAALKEATTAGVVEALARAAQRDEDESVRLCALQSLERRARTVDAHWLKAVIRDESRRSHERVRALVALVTAARRYRRATEGIWLAPLAAGEILHLLERPRADQLTEEAANLAAFVGDAAVPQLLALCKDESADCSLRCAACDSLGGLRARAGSAMFLDWLHREPDEVTQDIAPCMTKESRMAHHAAKALVAIDPALLLREHGTTATDVFARWALETGSLVFEDRVVGPDGRVTAMAPPADSGQEVAMVPWPEAEPGQADVQLLVKSDADDGRSLTFELKVGDPRLGPSHDEFGPVEVHTSLRSFRSDLMLDLERLAIGDAQCREICRQRLAVKGETLFQLLPVGLQVWLWILKAKAPSIELLSEDLYIPWELVRLRPQSPGVGAARFLSATFAMTRWVAGLSPRHQLPLSRVALVAPLHHELAAAKAEREYILSLHSPGIREVVEIESRYLPVKQALQSGEFDAWHFIGHADVRAEDPDRWRFPLEGNVALNPEDLRDAGAFGRRRPWVFLNACRTGQSGVSIDGTSGWARRFLAAGAGAFIGTNWSVSDFGAHMFVRALYSRFLRGKPLGEALLAARNEMLDDDPLTALAYSAFGHPLATCEARQLPEYR